MLSCHLQQSPLVLVSRGYLIVVNFNKSLFASFSDDTACPANWYGYKNTCYRFSSGNYQTAVTSCAEWGGFPSVPDSVVANSFIISIVTSLPYFSSLSQLYIGIITSHVGDFIETSDGRLLNQTNWSTGQPTVHAANKLTECTKLSASSGQWASVSCDSDLGFVCERHTGMLIMFLK